MIADLESIPLPASNVGTESVTDLEARAEFKHLLSQLCCQAQELRQLRRTAQSKQH